jgi:NADH dehydrogenase
LHKIIIVGAGFAGLQAAKGLTASLFDVTIIDKNNYHLFQPLLYQVATAGLSPADIALPIRNIFRSQNNLKVIFDELIGINPRFNQIKTSNNTYFYDFLVLATGSELSYFGHDQWRKFSPGLKTIEDATFLRAKILRAFEKAERENNKKTIKKLMKFVLIGGGPTGVEMAGAIAELSKKVLTKEFATIDTKTAQIILLEAGPNILSTASKSLSIYAKNSLAKLGVEVQCNTVVQNISENLVKTNTETIEAETIIWCAGVNASPLKSWIKVKTDKIGRVFVNEDLSIPIYPNIFVIGDASHVKDKNGEPLPGLAPVAKQEGNFVAEIIKRNILHGKTQNKFYYKNKGYLATIGRSEAIVDFEWFTLKGRIGWIFWSFIHIYFLVGFRNRFMVFTNWIWSYLTFGKGARLITNNKIEKESSFD